MVSSTHAPHIIQVVQHLRPGGIEVLALELLRHTLPNASMHIVSLEGDGQEKDSWPALNELCKHITFMNKPAGLHIPTIWKLSRLFKHMGATAIHTHHIGPLLYGGIAAKLIGIKHLVHTEHDSWHLQNNKANLLQHRLLTFLKPTLVADSSAIADDLRMHYPFTSPQVILNGIDTEKYTPGNQYDARTALTLPQEVHLIGCAARLEVVKNHIALIKAMATLPAHYHLALAGNGSLECELRNKVHQLGLEKRVHFLGHVEDMTSFYRSLDVFCLPSLKEGLPLSLLEAQSTNIPAIATDVGACREALAPDTGLLVQPNNASYFAKAIISVTSHKQRFAPRHFIEQNFTMKHMEQQYRALTT